MEPLNDLSIKYFKEALIRLNDENLKKITKVFEVISNEFNTQVGKRISAQIEIDLSEFEIEKVGVNKLEHFICRTNNAISIFEKTIKYEIDTKRHVIKLKFPHLNVLKKIVSLIQTEQKTRSLSPENNSPYLIWKNAFGKYFLGNDPIEMEMDSQYYKVFDILITYSDESGFLDYATIEKHLIKRGCTPEDDIKKRNNRINNAVSEKIGLFRFAHLNGNSLPNNTPGTKDFMIKNVRGKGLKINNPRVL